MWVLPSFLALLLSFGKCRGAYHVQLSMLLWLRLALLTCKTCPQLLVVKDLTCEIASPPPVLKVTPVALCLFPPLPLPCPSCPSPRSLLIAMFLPVDLQSSLRPDLPDSSTHVVKLGTVAYYGELMRLHWQQQVHLCCSCRKSWRSFGVCFSKRLASGC